MDYTLTLKIPFLVIIRRINKPWGADEERYGANFLKSVHRTLTGYCPNIPISLEEHALEGWTLRGTSKTSSHGRLSIDEWNSFNETLQEVPMALVRRGIPLETDQGTWKVFEEESREICANLNKMFHENVTDLSDVLGYNRNKNDKDSKKKNTKFMGKFSNLICGELCHMRVTLVPPEIEGLPGLLDLMLVKRIFVLMSGLEREMTLLSTPSSLLQFMPLSRFLEYYCIEELRKEKKELWKRLRNTIASEEKTRKEYAKRKEKWILGLNDENEKYKRTKGRKREWSDVIRCMDEDTWSSFIQTTQTCHGDLILSCNPPTQNNQEDSSTKNNPSTYPPPKLSSLTFQGHRSTLSADEFLAYTDLIASISRTALKPALNLPHWLENFRFKAPTSPLHSFQRLLDILDVRQSSKIFWHAHLAPLYREDAPPVEKIKRPSLRADPFFALRVHVEGALERERKYVPVFIGRYESVGGFCATEGEKVYALMQAGGGDRGEGEWLGGLKSVGVGEGKGKGKTKES